MLDVGPVPLSRGSGSRGGPESLVSDVAPPPASFAHLDVHTALAALAAQVWTPAYQARKPRAAETGIQIKPRDGAWIAEATGLVDLAAWPAGPRVL